MVLPAILDPTCTWPIRLKSMTRNLMTTMMLPTLLELTSTPSRLRDRIDSTTAMMTLLIHAIPDPTTPHHMVSVCIV